MNKILDDLIAILTQSNVAIPLVFGAVSSIVAIWKASGNNGPSQSEIADKIRTKCRENQLYGEAEIARLRNIIS